MARLITVTGGKGGVGKTNIAVNLSLCLGVSGRKVCLFDADLGLANINILLGIHPEFDLEDVISGQKALKDIIISDARGVDIIPGSSGVEKIANLSQKGINRLIDSFSGLDNYDFFIIDTSSGISKIVLTFCLPSPEIVIVITPEPTSMTDGYALLKVLSLNRYKGIIRLVFNQFRGKHSAGQIYNKLKKLTEDKLNIKVMPLGIVLQDEHVPEAAIFQCSGADF
jgi:flagellar biosynthesis protein FlhG